MAEILYSIFLKELDRIYEKADRSIVPEIARMKKYVLKLHEKNGILVMGSMIRLTHKLSRDIRQRDKEFYLDCILVMIYPGPDDEEIRNVWLKLAKERCEGRVPAEELIMSIYLAFNNSEKKEIQKILSKGIMRKVRRLNRCKEAKEEKKMFDIFRKKTTGDPEPKEKLVEYLSRRDMIAIQIRSKEEEMKKIIEQASACDELAQRIGHDRYKLLKRERDILLGRFNELGEAINTLSYKQMLSEETAGLSDMAAYTIDADELERRRDELEILKEQFAVQNERVKDLQRGDAPVSLPFDDDDDEFMRAVRKAGPEKHSEPDIPDTKETEEF